MIAIKMDDLPRLFSNSLTECFVHLQVAALLQARQAREMGAWHFMAKFLQGAVLLGGSFRYKNLLAVTFVSLIFIHETCRFLLFVIIHAWWK
jgi:hypothetical protein